MPPLSMHPELLNNPTFVRYCEAWRQNPASLVFAPLADFFCRYKLYAEARKVCEAGVRHNPDSVLAHYSLARTYICTREWHAARHEAQWVLARVANHQGAMDILHQVDQRQVPVRHIMMVQSEVARTTMLRASSAAPQNDKLAGVMTASGGSSLPIAVVEIAGGAELPSGGPPLQRGDGRNAATGPAISTTATPSPKRSPQKPMPWQTVTMAKIYSRQGLYYKARTIYKTILSRDPRNVEARAGLATLEQVIRDAAA